MPRISLLPLLAIIAFLARLIAPITPAHAATVHHHALAPAIPGLNLTASPPLVDVGGTLVLTLTATSWPGPVFATTSFLSGHHGFTGKMTWFGSCSCFKVAISLAKRIHGLEPARAVATVLFHGAKYTAPTSFMIRGLDKNGKDFAPGGPQGLTTWVNDPQPRANETVHFCAWVKTPDGLGVPGVKVKFVVHYSNKTQKLSAGATQKTGIVCARKSIGNAKAGKSVSVDAYAGTLHAQTKFIPQSVPVTPTPVAP